jgi:glutamyl-tRNA synthetase
MSTRLRFAPSPTGYLHVGGARTALFNWLMARKVGGTLVLRIEDTDRQRSSDEHTEAILHGMRWLGLDWDEGPLFQGAGLERHVADVERMLSSGRAYRDFSTPQEAEADRAEEMEQGTRTRRARERADALGLDEAGDRAARGEPHAVRFRVPDGETVWEDLVHGETRFRNSEIDDLVLLRSDRTPTYNLAVVSDDAHMEITHVIRGDDHLSNTPKQILIFEALGLPVPDFGHVPLILGPDGKRLSKRHGATAVGAYEAEGILPEAMVNFLALLGWSPGDDREVFELAELIDAFSMERVGKKSSVFDLTKLQWLNGQHLARRPTPDLVPLVLDALHREDPALAAAARARDPEWLTRLVDLLKVRARTLDDLADQARPFLAPVGGYEERTARKQFKRPGEVGERLSALAVVLAETTWSESALEEALRSLAESRDEGAGKFIHPLRLALTGRGASPGIFEVLVLLGRDPALQRIEAAERHLERLAADEPRA